MTLQFILIHENLKVERTLELGIAHASMITCPKAPLPKMTMETSGMNFHHCIIALTLVFSLHNAFTPETLHPCL